MMASTAAPTVGLDLPEELVRETRARYEDQQLERRATPILGAWSTIVVAGVAACAVFVDRGPAFSILTAAFFVALYAVASRVEFEVGNGAAIPTELVLVPMLFAVPVGVVPALVALGLIVRTVGERPWPLRTHARVFALLATTAHALGPVLVIAFLGGLPLRWGAWPVYVAALAAQFGFDWANTAVNAYAHRMSLRRLARIVGLVAAVDAALASIGLAIAFAAQTHVLLATLVLPLVGLLRYFSSERQRRIDNALELSDAYRGTAFLLGDVVEADDAYTGSHSRHVVDLVLGVADELKLNASDRRDAEFVALLHDVGKIRIPGSIINKPGPLDAEERALMETHTVEGEQMLERVGGALGRVGRLVRSCHEHWDGNGYPDKLVGEEIPRVARIVCACDAFSAMTTDRPYRKARSQRDALAELQRCSGTQFDPHVVDALLRVNAAG
jgi:HD-GYP domain-containing protein (c-di-GMP phosphodiesterase class II)